MKNNLLKASLFSLLALVSCGGGGGGGGGGSNARPSTGFRVLHANIEAPPLDIYKAGETTASANVRFSESSGYVSSDPQDQALSLTTSNIPTELASSTVIPLTKGSVKTLMLYGDNGSIGNRSVIFEDPLDSAPDGMAMVRVIHGAVGAAKIRASAGSTSISDDTAFGSVSDYVQVAPGAVSFVVERVVDNTDLFNATLTLEAGKVYSLFVSGDMNYFATGKLLNDN